MSGNVTLQDLVYFGAVWQLLNGTPSQTAPIVLGGGYRDALVTRSADGQFFAGVVEQVDACGQITGVVLAFSGAAGAPDFLAAQAIKLNLPSSMAADATAMFDQLMANPLYANATIHVTGHSLGAGLTQFVLGHALATYGAATTAARADFMQFAPPGWEPSVASHFGLARDVFDGHISAYVAQNDPVLDVLGQGDAQMGVINYLAPYHAAPLAIGINNISAHYPTTFIDALGLPSWMSSADQAATRALIAAQSPTPLASNYGPVGGVSMVMVGDGAANVLHGSRAGDVLIGRDGQDALHGGLGSDLFVFSQASASTLAAPDLVADFSRAQGDKIDLRGIYGGHIQFIGTAAFSAPGQVRSWNDGADTWVAGAFGSDASATFLVQFDGVLPLAASDFLLNAALFQPQYTIGFVLY